MAGAWGKLHLMLPKSRGVFCQLGKTCAWLAILAFLGTPAAYSQNKFETPEETNARIRQLALATQAKQGEYVIGGGDLLVINVFDVPELSREVRVGESGYISMPLLPVRVHAGGLTSFQLEEKLAELLQVNGLVAHPQVSVAVKEQRSHPITVIGAVQHPMVYQAVRQTTLLEVLSEAGGIAPDAGNAVIITRAAPEPVAGATPGSDASTGAPPLTINISLSDLLDSGDGRFNIPLLPGDVVSIPRAGVVYVVGAVDHPGGFVMQNDREQMTTLKVLALAGGLKGSAKPREAVIVRRNGPNGQTQEVPVDLTKVLARKSEDVRMLPSDILFVPDSAGKRALRRMGEVAIGLTTGITVVRAGR